MNMFDDLPNSTTVGEIEETSALYTKCDCGWVRYVPAARFRQNQYYHHGVYGFVTVIEAAERDAMSHTCYSYQRAVDRYRAALELGARDWGRRRVSA